MPRRNTPAGPATRWASAGGDDWTAHIDIRAGAIVLIRVSDDPEFRARLVHAAGILRDVARPGIERFVALEDRGGVTRLVTAFVGARSLATDPPERPADLWELTTTLCGTVVALHGAGVVHGRIAADRVLLGHGGVPVLCDFSAAERPDAARLEACQREDLAALGDLLASLSKGVRRRPLSHPLEWRGLHAHRRLCRELSAGAVPQIPTFPPGGPHAVGHRHRNRGSRRTPVRRLGAPAVIGVSLVGAMAFLIGWSAPSLGF